MEGRRSRVRSKRHARYGTVGRESFSQSSKLSVASLHGETRVGRGLIGRRVVKRRKDQREEDL
jgi:hypothetical protein